MIVILFLLAHYFTIIWLVIDEENKEADDVWINKFGYQDMRVNDPSQLYFIMLYELISCALGYNRLEVLNENEKFFALFWMIVGIAFFS